MKLYASLVSLAAIVPMFWYNIIPWAAQYCPVDNSGKVVAYTVLRPNGFGEIVTLVFDGDFQSDLCTNVANNPAPVK